MEGVRGGEILREIRGLSLFTERAAEDLEK